MKLHLVTGLGCALVALAAVASAEQKAPVVDGPPHTTGAPCAALVCQPQTLCAVSRPGDVAGMGAMGVVALAGVAALRAARRRVR